MASTSFSQMAGWYQSGHPTTVLFLPNGGKTKSPPEPFRLVVYHLWQKVPVVYWLVYYRLHRERWPLPPG
ncbi:hypothetical protein EYC84_007672 [Monilinia fructicola]|uniref:Uncharacterized protein n=1 Tax=Monilinia fructicola TaxID=38448 RepID=A0A5M9JNS6_MONFR|nr:hypothetical protein EYC84_007672 [Monilinia fructicola]